MLDSGLPQHMWNHAVTHSAYLCNRSARSQSDQSPCQLFWKNAKSSTPVKILHLRRFGCAVYFHKPPNQTMKSAKFSPQAIQGYLLGMQDNSYTNYKVWLPQNNAVTYTPHVTFDETRVYRDNVSSTLNTDIETVETTLDQMDQRVPHTPTQHERLSSTSSGGDIDASDTIEDAPDNKSDTSDNITVAYPRQDNADNASNVDNISSSNETSNTRSRRDTQRLDYRTLHRGYLATALLAQPSTPFSITEPTSYKHALSCAQSKNWQASMEREVQQLEEQQTWDVVSALPPGRILIKGR
jgi:hypothetical protein